MRQYRGHVVYVAHAFARELHKLIHVRYFGTRWLHKSRNLKRATGAEMRVHDRHLQDKTCCKDTDIRN
jgi:hypothetical protein